MKLEGTNRNPRRIGLMGGTFNPIHIGHLVTAEEAFYQFKLDEIIFIPSGKPPHKTDGDIAPAEDRYLMTVIATASNPHFTVSRIEIDRVGPSYTVDTLREMKKIYGEETELFFITGADAIIEILTWKDPEIIADLCEFIAATRPGYSLRKFEELHLVGNKKLPKVHFMEIPALAISSTDIRKRVKEGRPIKYLVPEGVAEYLTKRGLYRELP
ncbi:MAG: nicotinate-nucleotide adenylyltransferase [Nitrososphaeria archaeon]